MRRLARSRRLGKPCRRKRSIGSACWQTWRVRKNLRSDRLFQEGKICRQKGQFRNQDRVGQARSSERCPPSCGWWAGARTLACPTLRPRLRPPRATRLLLYRMASTFFRGLAVLEAQVHQPEEAACRTPHRLRPRAGGPDNRGTSRGQVERSLDRAPGCGQACSR